MDLDLKVISGPKAASITDGFLTLGTPDGHVYFHHEDRLIRIRLFGYEVREVAAHTIIEHTGTNPNTPGRVNLIGMTDYAIPAIIKKIVDEN
eukprot:3812728-Pyramimonas_sp.AAC.1